MTTNNQPSWGEDKVTGTCICGKCPRPTLAETRSAIMAMALDKELNLDDVTVAKILNSLSDLTKQENE